MYTIGHIEYETGRNYVQIEAFNTYRMHKLHEEAPLVGPTNKKVTTKFTIN